MWISNTATAVMLLPIGLAIIYKMEEQFGKEATKKFSLALLLSIAYACSVGGLGTLIGTPPNLVFQRVFSIQFPDRPEIVFSEWMIFAVPLSLVMLVIIWLLLTKVFFRVSKNVVLQKDVIKSERIKLGKMSYEEKAVLIVFTLTAVLWIFRNDLEAGIFTLPGWSSLLSTKDYIDDGTIAIMMGLLLFIIPAKDKTRGSSAILGNKIIRKIPWEIILLFGGGFALAEGFVATGLSETIGAQFAGLQGMPIYLLILIICLSITFLTELTSNTATAQIILPILASLSVQLNLDPFLLMIPATLSASMAFMMPVATPPNAIIFGSDRIKVKDMAKTGLAINFIGAFLISAYIYFVFG
jgi:sodium-dependent dicarboxylate transporter 2/3/5